MMTAVLLGIVAVAAVVAAGLFVFGARIEGTLNRVTELQLPPVAAAAAELHRSSVVVDLHADPLLWGRDLLERSTVGHVDLPRLRAGGVALQVFGLVTAIPLRVNIERTNPRWPDAITLLALAKHWPLKTLRSRKERALYQARRLARMAEASRGRLVLIRSAVELDRLVAARTREPGVVGGLLAIEGAHALDGDLGNLGALFDAGVRMIGLTHFSDNPFAGSAHGLEKGGLTERGRTLVREAERRGIIVDLAHASAATINDVLTIATNPPIVSHTGVRGTCDNQRNLSDHQIRAIARAGGVIGIGLWETAVCGLAPENVARAVKYVVDLAGEGHVALGSDFDGGVTTGFDSSAMPSITQALINVGLGEDAIRGALGGNALRLLRNVLPKS